MSEQHVGYGPPGIRYPYCLLIHGVKHSSMGTEITIVLDDDNFASKIMVAFPPEDPEWRSKFITVLDPGPPSIRSCSVVVPPGHPILAIRPLHEDGEAIPELCCMYRIAQNDFLKDIAPERRVSELVGAVGDGETHVSDEEDFESRIVHKGQVYNCCLCGVIVPADKGYKFKELGGDQVRALRLMSEVAEEFPFVCHDCYRRKVGVTQGAIGSATFFQGILNMLLRIATRGYAGAWITRYMLGYTKEEALMAGAFLGSFVSFEAVPSILLNIARHPLMMMGIFLGPVAFGAGFLMKPELFRPLLDDPLSIFGEGTRFVDAKVALLSLKGSSAGLVLGLLLGVTSPTPEKPKHELPHSEEGDG